MLRHVSNPPNPWQARELEYIDEVPQARFEVFEDVTRTILSRNDPAEVGFEFGLNPYRGCQHACAYCEARRRHELLGFGAGTDFDTKIVVKPRAAELLQEAFERPSRRGDVVVFSGATDCYQPLEASYRLMRACLEVCAEYKNPVAIITKGFLRLPAPVDAVFEERLRATFPLRADKVLARAREGGAYTTMIGAIYDTTYRRLGLAHSPPATTV